MQLAKGFVFSVNTPGLVVFGQIDDVLRVGLAVCLFNEGLFDFDFYFSCFVAIDDVIFAFYGRRFALGYAKFMFIKSSQSLLLATKSMRCVLSKSSCDSIGLIFRFNIIFTFNLIIL